MRKAGMSANMISFSAAISACEKGNQWEQALTLPDNMREPDRTADMISYTAISACEKRCQ